MVLVVAQKESLRDDVMADWSRKEADASAGPVDLRLNHG